MNRLTISRASALAAMALALGACDAGRDPLGPSTGTEAPDAARGGNGGTTSTPRIAFSAFTQSSNLYTVNLDGTGYGLIPNGENGGGPAWSPDGKKLAFTNATGDGAGVWVMGADGRGRKRIFVGAAWGATWSPDGSRILFVGQVDSTHSVIQVIRPNGRDRRELTSVDGQSRWHPTWSPDGGRIAYEEYHTLGSRLMVMNADGTSHTPILDCATLAAQCSSPAWSPVPGDERIVFTVRDGDARAIVTIKVDGTDYRNVIYGTEHVAFDFHPAWSPDGTQFVFSSAKAGNLDLYLMNTDGTDIRQLTSTPIAETLPSWSR